MFGVFSKKAFLYAPFTLVVLAPSAGFAQTDAAGNSYVISVSPEYSSGSNSSASPYSPPPSLAPPVFKSSLNSAVVPAPSIPTPSYPVAAPTLAPPVFKTAQISAAPSEDSPVSSSNTVQPTIHARDISSVPVRLPKDPNKTPAADAPIPLGSPTGGEFGLMVSNYRYQVHDVANVVAASQTGIKFGAVGSATKLFHQGLLEGIFLTGDFRFGYSANTLSISTAGTENNVPNYLWDVRLVAGQDFLFKDPSFSLSPYAGLGYWNDLSNGPGTTSKGFLTCGADNRYLYVPLGVTPRLRLSNGARLSPNIEYDYFIKGWTESYLGEFNDDNLSNVTDKLHNGYGMRGSLMYESKSWALGPFVNYWNINKGAPVLTTGYSSSGNTHNQTIDYGLQARYRF
jgi:hypothetical protein